MSIIEVAVAGRGIQVKQGYEKPSAGDVNTCQVSLAIDSGGVWDGLPHKRVTFATRTASVTVDYAPTITIPHEVLASPGALYLTLTGYDADGIEVARTHRMTYPIEVARAGADEGAEPSPATLDVVSRIDALAADLEEKRDTDYWRGEQGPQGEPGPHGVPGPQGAPGAPGAPGADGYSPTASVTKNGGTATITVTDKNGTTTATVSDGAPGKDGSDATATDVRIAGNSITVDGVADIPLASNTNIGLVKLWEYGGLVYGGAGLEIVPASEATISARNGSHYLIPADSRLDYAVKAAMCDGKGAAWTADEQSAARERMNAADANKVYIMQKQIENLQGIAATEETDSTEAYTKTVPTGAQKWASLDSVGGNTVVWNQLADFKSSRVAYGLTLSRNSDGSYSITGTTTQDVASDCMLYLSASDNLYVEKGRKYLTSCGNDNWQQYIYNNVQSQSLSNVAIFEATASGSNTSTAYRPTNTISAGTTVNEKIYPILIDLTKMFGAGNEPTDLSDPRIAAIMTYADAHPEYNAGELLSACVTEVASNRPYGTFYSYSIPQSVIEKCPLYGASAGTVCNEIDFAAKKYIQRVGRVDLGTIDWKLFYGKDFFYADFETGYEFSTTVKNVPCSKYVGAKGEHIYNATADKCIAINDSFISTDFERTYIRDTSYTDAASFKASLHGVFMYYILSEPVEIDLSDVLSDDNFIEVEAGGTVTFKQASTQLPVPSAVTYQISTSEVIANA